MFGYSICEGRPIMQPLMNLSIVHIGFLSLLNQDSIVGWMRLDKICFGMKWTCYMKDCLTRVATVASSCMKGQMSPSQVTLGPLVPKKKKKAT